MDREKVISEFEDFVKSFSKRKDTYYKGLFVSVLVLLKEQEKEIENLKEIIKKADHTLQIVKGKLNDLLKKTEGR